MTEIEKVAVLLIALGPDRSRRILDRLGPDDLLPIVRTMKGMKKVSPEDREAVLEEVNGILEDLAAASFPGSGFDPDAPSEPELPSDPEPPASTARDIIEQVQDELPDRIEPDSLPDIDWGAAGFDFGSGRRGTRADGDDDEDTPPDRGRRR